MSSLFLSFFKNPTVPFRLFLYVFFLSPGGGRILVLSVVEGEERGKTRPSKKSTAGKTISRQSSFILLILYIRILGEKTRGEK